MIGEGSVVVLSRDIEVNGSILAAGTSLVVHRVFFADDDEFQVSTPSAPLDRFWVRRDEIDEEKP